MQATPAATVAHSGAWHGAADTDPVLADEDVKGERGRVRSSFCCCQKIMYLSFFYSNTSTSSLAGLIFDLDGTIVDTMPFYWPSWAHTCAKFGMSRFLCSLRSSAQALSAC